MTLKGILAVCIGYGGGILCSIAALKKRAELNRAKGWLSTQGTILESMLIKVGNETNFRVRYEFHVGERIEGATPRLAGEWFWNKKLQAAFVGRYTPGQAVEVFYDPGDPKKNCLDKSDTSGIVILWIMAAGGVGLATMVLWLGMMH